MMCDDDLIRRAKDGCPDAWSELVGKFKTGVQSSLHIHSKWQSVVDVSDIMQITYMDLANGLERFDGDEPGFGRWFRSIAKNNLRDVISGLEAKKRPQPDQKLPEVLGETGYDRIRNELFDTGRSPSSECRLHESSDRMKNAIGYLPHGYQEVLRLVFFEQKSNCEAARILGVRPGVVTLWKKKALEELRRILGG